MGASVERGSETMHVLLGTAYFESHRGGIEIVAGRLAREFARRNVHITWFASDTTPPPSAHDSCGAALPVSAWNITERRLGVPLPLPGASALLSIWRAVKRCDAVVLHDSLYPTNVVAMLAARWSGKPVVLVQHIAVVPYQNPVLRVLMGMANMLITRPMLAAADQVVFISATVSAHYSGVRFKAPPRLIFNGVDTNAFRPPGVDFEKSRVRSSFGLPLESKLVLFVGRFVEKKGLHILQRLARRRPDLTFALAGWGPIDPRAWKLPNVHVFSNLQGAVLVRLYQASDVFILPSIGEGFPLVLQEALACGLPVLCGRETTASDPAVSARVVGVEITDDPGNTSAAFAARLDQVLDETTASTRDATARARYAFVLGRYSWTEAAEAYLSVVTDLVATKTTPAAVPMPEPHR